MSDRVEQAKLYAERARRFASRGDYPAAIEQQEAAVGLFREELAEQAATFPEGEPATAHLLSDHLGRLGGFRRRAGRLAGAADAYAEGARIETRYRLADSYNLTNSIVVRILAEPAALPKLAQEIDDAAARVAAQVERDRRDQWWAWADLGLLSLLIGQVHVARRAYDSFARTGARPTDYDSVLEVLRGLRDRLEGPAPGIADGIARTIGSLEADLDRLRPGQTR